MGAGTYGVYADTGIHAEDGMTATIPERWPLPGTALKPALSLVLAIEHATMGILMLRNEATGALEPVITEGLTDEQSTTFGLHRPGVGPVGVALSEHRRVFVRDVMVDGDGAAEPTFREIARGVGFRALDVVPLTIEDGTVIGALAVLFPIARRPSARSARLAERCAQLMALALDNARLRATAERRREIVESLARARVQFVARISHELRTPLQSITGYIDLLRVSARSALTPQQQRILDRVFESEQILIHVIGDLTNMARLEAGRLEYHLATVNACDAVCSSVDVIRPLADEKGVEVTLGDTQNATHARADAAKLKQILINLLANAIKYTPSGGGVQVSCRDDGTDVVFEVADTGHGIPKAELGKVFEPYVQLATPEHGLVGSGLGLAISREFALGMGGSLTASSQPGIGSVFTLRIPGIQAPASSAAPPALPVAQTTLRPN